MPEHWVINASPIILLSKANVISFLPRLCDTVVIPAGVVDEIAIGERGDAARTWLAAEGTRFVRPAPPAAEELSGADLGSGERQVLSWAFLNRGFKAVLDDRRGRTWAQRLNVPLIGSLGVIVLMKKRGLISAAAPVLEKVRSAGAYISQAAIREAIEQAGEA